MLRVVYIDIQSPPIKRLAPVWNQNSVSNDNQNDPICEMGRFSYLLYRLSLVGNSKYRHDRFIELYTRLHFIFQVRIDTFAHNVVIDSLFT